MCRIFIILMHGIMVFMLACLELKNSKCLFAVLIKSRGVR